jgi:hypothetical protein
MLTSAPPEGPLPLPAAPVLGSDAPAPQIAAVAQVSDQSDAAACKRQQLGLLKQLRLFQVSASQQRDQD